MSSYTAGTTVANGASECMNECRSNTECSSMMVEKTASGDILCTLYSSMAVGAVSSSDALKCDAEVGQSGNDDKACLLKSPSLAAGATLQRLGAGACAREEFFRPDPTSPTLKTLKYQNAISKKVCAFPCFILLHPASHLFSDFAASPFLLLL